MNNYTQVSAESQELSETCIQCNYKCHSVFTREIPFPSSYVFNLETSAGVLCSEECFDVHIQVCLAELIICLNDEAKKVKANITGSPHIATIQDLGGAYDN